MEAAQADLKKIQDNLERLQAQADSAAEASAALEDELSAEVGIHSTLLQGHLLLCRRNVCCGRRHVAISLKWLYLSTVPRPLEVTTG